MKWNVFCFLGGNGCFIAAAFASNASRDDVVCGTSGMILRGIVMLLGTWPTFFFLFFN